MNNNNNDNIEKLNWARIFLICGKNSNLAKKIPYEIFLNPNFFSSSIILGRNAQLSNFQLDSMEFPGCISGRHCELKYDEKNKWKIIDLNR